MKTLNFWHEKCRCYQQKIPSATNTYKRGLGVENRSEFDASLPVLYSESLYDNNDIQWCVWWIRKWMGNCGCNIWSFFPHVLINFFPEKIVEIWVLLDLFLPFWPLKLFVHLYNVFKIIKSKFSSTHVYYELGQIIQLHIYLWCESHSRSVSINRNIFHNKKLVL